MLGISSLLGQKKVTQYAQVGGTNGTLPNHADVLGPEG